MKDITSKDLKESLTLLLCERQQDDMGGWKEIWQKGPQFWGFIWPLMNPGNFQAQDPGGPMAANQGYIQILPPPHYRLILRRGLQIPLKAQFLWHLRHQEKRLLLINQPVFIQYNQFLCMTVVEAKQWENF